MELVGGVSVINRATFFLNLLIICLGLLVFTVVSIDDPNFPNI